MSVHSSHYSASHVAGDKEGIVVREELERLWRSRLAEAKLRLDFARNYVNEVRQDFPIDDTSPDGHYALQRALRAENVALVEFHRILRVYTGLVMDGKMPDEEGSQRRMAPGAGSM